MLFQILKTTFPRRIGDTGVILCMYIFFSGHMLLPNVLQMYYGPRLCCQGGISLKNVANPVMINHLPKFAITCRIRIVQLRHQQNSSQIAFGGMLVSFSVKNSVNAEFTAFIE